MGTKYSFSVRSDYYRAVAVARSTDKTRHLQLQGVYIQPHPVEGVFLVATDGHRMIVAHDAAGMCSEPLIVSINGDALKAGKARKSERANPRRFVASDENMVRVVVHGESANEYEWAWRMDGTFPDWRRVLPDVKMFKEATPGFNPAYIADFAKAQEELLRDGPCIAIRTAGLTGPALVTFGEFTDAFGVLMPIKIDAASTWIPYFMSPKYAPAKATAA